MRQKDLTAHLIAIGAHPDATYTCTDPLADPGHDLDGWYTVHRVSGPYTTLWLPYAYGDAARVYSTSLLVMKASGRVAERRACFTGSDRDYGCGTVERAIETIIEHRATRGLNYPVTGNGWADVIARRNAITSGGEA